VRRAQPCGARDEQAPTAAFGRRSRAATSSSTSPRVPSAGPRTRAVDVRGTARLATDAGDAGIAHLIYTSIVGIDAIPWRYFRVKLEAEGVVRAAPLRWSILRATQFYR
jgi:uncharacterized protein YbjT (DUF2867 family)